MRADLTAGGPDEPPKPLPGAPAAVGDVLDGRWSVTEVRAGGQAWVLVADDRERGGRRAIKVPRSDALGDAEFAALLGLAPHPHVVTALATTEIAGRRSLVLEYVPRTLADVAHGRSGAAPWHLPRPAVLQEICAGMAYLSDRAEVAHLDLKPSNVLIDGDGRAKVADLGLSRPVRTRDGRYPAAPGGTWAYAAPEVIRQEPYDSRADVFSFGVLLYQLCTGRLPYPFPLAPDPDGQRAQLLRYYASDTARERTRELYHFAQMAELREIPVPPPTEEIGDVLSGCLQLDMGERYQTFAQLATAFAVTLGIPEVRAEAAPLPEADARLRELALSEALTRLGRHDDAVRRLNRLLAAPLPPPVLARVRRAAQQALIGAGRPEDAAALDGWG